MFKKLSYLVLILIFVLVGCEEEISFSQTEVITKKNQVVVDVKGEIAFPGLYSVDEGSLLIDVVNLAGGFLKNADVRNINLASIVENNQMIIIPSVSITSNLVNINTASVEELMTLPKIGKTKAENISNYRKSIGKFTSIEQLKNVEGLSDSIFEEIKTMVTL